MKQEGVTVPVPTPDPLSSEYRKDYWFNWQQVLYKRKPDESLMSRCYVCKVVGVLARDLKHRGLPLRRSNLLCDCCYRDDADDGKKAATR